MPIIDEQTINSTQPVPSSPADGFDVSAISGAVLTVSQLVDLDKYSLRHYGLIDDNLPNGTSQYPTSTGWPEMLFPRTRVGQEKERSTSTYLYVPLIGVQRYSPRIIDWVTSGPSPSLTWRLRSLDIPAHIALKLSVQLPGLTEVEQNRLIGILEDAETPRRLDGKWAISPEVSDDIDIDPMYFVDLTGISPIPGEGDIELELFDLSMTKHTSAQFTVAMLAPSTNLTIAPNPHIIGHFPSSGLASFRVHDVVGGSGAFVLIKMGLANKVNGDIFTFVAFD